MGYIVWVLQWKLWGKVLVGQRLRSQNWWRIQLENEINSSIIEINKENLWECKTAEPPPIPFEIEYNFPNLNWEMLMKLKPLKINNFQIG